MKHKNLILSLIKDDIVHCRLLAGLQALGFDTSPYLLRLGDTVFALMKLDAAAHPDSLFEYYMWLTQRAGQGHPLHPHRQLDALALEIYLALQSGQQAVK